MVRRLMRARARMRRLRRASRGGEGAGRRGRDGSLLAGRLRRRARAAAGRLADGARRPGGPELAALTPLLAPGRHRHRRRQLLLPRRHPPRRGARRRRASTTSTWAPAAACAGCERGYCLMIGGEADVGASGSTRSSRRSRPASTPPRARPGAKARGGTAERGYLHCGPSGAGHFVKMVHNGIEYGLMAAYAEGSTSCTTPTSGIAHAGDRRRDDAAAAIRSTTSTSSTSPRSPRSGAAAA